MEYKKLRNGVRLKLGDQYFGNDGSWHTSSGYMAGAIIGRPGWTLKYRRPISRRQAAQRGKQAAKRK